jgi:thioredoxin reductase
VTDPHAIDGKFPTPSEHAEIVVVGGGPAGCAAAIEAAQAGGSVILVDENPVGAGLIGLDVPFLFGGRATAAVQNRERMVEQVFSANPALGEAFEAGVDVRLGTYAWGAWVNGPGLRALPVPVVGLADETRSFMVGFDRLIVASGARDLVLSFAGSDRPGVVGAQALHALLVRYGAFAGRRLVVLGSGVLAVEAAALALDGGLEVTALVEVRDAPEAHPERIAALAARGVEIVTGHAPLRAHAGPDGVEALVLAAVDDPGRQREISCDTVCLAVGAVPSVELLDVLGVSLALDPARGGFVPAAGPDCGASTSLDRVFVAGDCAGLGGDAEEQGREAARAAVRSLGRASPSPRGAAGQALPAAPRGEGNAYQLDWARALWRPADATFSPAPARRSPAPSFWASTRRAISAGRRGTASAARPRRVPRRRPHRPGPRQAPDPRRHGPCQGRRCREQVALMLVARAGVPVGTIPLAGYRAPGPAAPLVRAGGRQRDARHGGGLERLVRHRLAVDRLRRHRHGAREPRCSAPGCGTEREPGWRRAHRSSWSAAGSRASARPGGWRATGSTCSCWRRASSGGRRPGATAAAAPTSRARSSTRSSGCGRRWTSFWDTRRSTARSASSSRSIRRRAISGARSRSGFPPGYRWSALDAKEVRELVPLAGDT